MTVLRWVSFIVFRGVRSSSRIMAACSITVVEGITGRPRAGGTVQTRALQMVARSGLRNLC